MCLTGSEELFADGQQFDNAKILAFWRWGFSNLRVNDVRGIFAEWLIGVLLGIELTTRVSWAGWDLETASGIKIEVKAAAYLQEWAQKGPSRIVFTRLKGQLWDPLTGYSGTATYNADLYVFCVQIERDPERWNALDMGQWRFHLLPREALAGRNLKSISLSTLSTMTVALTVREFRREAEKMIESIAAAREGATDQDESRPGDGQRTPRGDGGREPLYGVR